MLSQVSTILGGAGLVGSTWADEIARWGRDIARYRRYVEGAHDAKLTNEMRQMLRIEKGQDFNANYCETVVDTMADRLAVSKMDADTTEGSAWAAEVMQANRFDGLQMDVHPAAVGDGDTFVMVAWDGAARRVLLAHEPAFDGEVGMIPVYDRQRQRLLAAVKVWYENTSSDDRRINIYYPDRVEKYVAGEERMTRLVDEADTGTWTMIDGTALGVPVFHFKNRSRSRVERGMSEIKSAIPLQDALNRTLTSMVMTSELTAFPVRVARGFNPPANVSPGMWVVVGGDGLSSDQVADASVMAQGQISPFIEQARFLIYQIGTITRTPLPDMMGSDSSSGESLKQREIGLLAKVKKLQVKFGNVWEDVFAFAVKVQQAFGAAQPPAVTRFDCKWQEAQMRNDAEVISNVVAVRDAVGEREFLRLIGGVFGYDEARVEQIMTEKRREMMGRLGAMVEQIPGFGLSEEIDQ
jgi:hypothetical protein